MTASPQVSIATCFCYDIPLEKQLPLIRAAGFTHVSLGARADHFKTVTANGGMKRLRELVEDHGLAVDTIHGKNLEVSNSFRSARNSAESAAELGARAVVLHPGPFDLPEREFPGHLEDLLATCATLVNVAEDMGVSFALENVMPGPASELAAHAVQAFDHPRLGLCYDSSHDQIGGPRPFDLLKRLKKRVNAVHLSDRSGPHVDHLVPGEGFIDWDALSRALGRSGYRAPVLVEAMIEHSKFRKPEVFLKKAFAAGRKIWRKLHGRADT